LFVHLLFGLYFVDSGRFAQPNTAPTIVGAVSVGESDHNHNEAESTEPRSNRESLLAAIIRFFRDNPGDE
jgi:hypothetical protein